MEARFARHEKLATMMRKGLTDMDFMLVPENGFAANTMSAVYHNGIEDVAFRGQLAHEGVVVAGGLGKLKGKIFRIGHMGAVTKNDIAATLTAIQRTIEES